MQDENRHDAPQEVQAEAKQPVGLPTTEQKQDGQVNVPEEQAPVQGELPEEAKERTREQFEKLKAHNAELAKKLSQYEQAKKPSIFDLTPQGKPVQQVAPQVPAQQVSEIKPIVPDAEGYVDVNAINATIQQINADKERALRQAEEATRMAQAANDNISRFEIKQTSQAVFQKHPELDPDNTSFDDKLTHLVKLELLRQMTEEGTQDYMKAADFVKNNLYQPKAAKKQGSEEARSARADINAFTPQASSNQTSDDDLRARSYKGDRDAIYERLKRSGY
jgi:hypothetical protein